MKSGFRQLVAAAVAVTSSSPLFCQDLGSIAPQKPTAFIFVRQYKAPYVPPIRMGNSGRLASLIRAGHLYLTAQDAIALALENNIDLEVARYTPLIDQWALTRAEAGGALPGVPSGASRVGSVALGQGVRGSQAAAGVSTTGGGTGTGNAGNAAVSQIGPVTPNLDPVFQDSTVFSHTSSPQSNLRQSVVPNLIDNTRNYTTSLQQGFLSGGTATLTYTESYLNENAPTNVLNPTYAPNLQISIQHNLLQGFGTALNRRTIDVAKLNVQIDDLNFRAQVISVVNNVLTMYYALVADYQDFHAKQRAVEVAQQFYENNRKQVEVGTLAPLDVTTAESQLATSQQDLVDSQATLETQQLQLKNALSRPGMADPLLQNVDIIPLDRIEVPEQDTLPAFKDLVAQAEAHRVDIAAERLNFRVAGINALGTENDVRPQLAVFANASNAGQAGSPRLVPQSASQVVASSNQQYPPGFVPCPAPNVGRVCEAPDPYLVGGLSNSLGQVFRRNYPAESAGTFFSARLRNRQNQADYAIDQLTMRQTQLQDQKDLNQIAVDVANQTTALRQARARYMAAVKNRVLSQQLLDAEQKKFSLGASTPYNVVTQERDLATAQSTEVSALVAYSNARIALDQALGTTLQAYQVHIDEARTGHVARTSGVPASVPPQP